MYLQGLNLFIGLMGLIQNFAVIALFSGAYMSNPDEESFKKFLETEYRR